MSKKLGRPTRYTKTMGERICKQIREGKTLRYICEPENMPHRSTILRWRFMPSLQVFRNQYDAAMIDRVDSFADEIVDIADDGTNDTYVDDMGNVRTDTDVIQRSKLRIETRLKLMAKLKPKTYGDKLDLTSGGERIEQPIKVFKMRPADIKKDS